MKTQAIYTLDDGTVCIGNECMVVKIPPKGKGNVQIEVGECPEEVKEKLAYKVGVEGSAVEFTTKESKK
jgi:hypothetical protein